MKKPLEGIRVLDMTGLLPGPFCSLILADYGAEVIKIEQPGLGDNIRRSKPLLNDTSSIFLLLNRNKKSLTLNLKSQKGKEIFYELVANADVIIEGYRPGVVSKLGVDYDTVRKINPRLVYCSITGYGQNGPYALQAGHDINYISYAGMLGIKGRNEGMPSIPSFQIADICGGSLMASNGILLALMAREHNGQGQYVDIAMLDGVISCLPIFAGTMFAGNMAPGSEKTRLTGRYACYAIYSTRDEGFISLGALEPHFWERVCKFFDKEEYVKYQNEDMKQEEIFSFLTEQFLLRDRDEWIEIFRQIDVCLAPVYGLDEVFTDPQVLHREMIFDMEHPRLGKIKQLGFPIKMSMTQPIAQQAAPDLGQHTNELLMGLGYTENDLEVLRQQGTI